MHPNDFTSCKITHPSMTSNCKVQHVYTICVWEILSLKRIITRAEREVLTKQERSLG